MERNLDKFLLRVSPLRSFIPWNQKGPWFTTSSLLSLSLDFLYQIKRGNVWEKHGDRVGSFNHKQGPWQHNVVLTSLLLPSWLLIPEAVWPRPQPRTNVSSTSLRSKWQEGNWSSSHAHPVGWKKVSCHLSETTTRVLWRCVQKWRTSSAIQTLSRSSSRCIHLEDLTTSKPLELGRSLLLVLAWSVW